MMNLQQWLESYDIDSKAALCVALSTTGFSPSKGKLIGVHVAPLWNDDLHTMLISGADEPEVTKNLEYTGIAYDEYQLRARNDKGVRAKLEELLEYTHYVVCYNKSFFAKWIGANDNEALVCLEEFPVLDICNCVKCREEGEDYSGLSFDTVFELDDWLNERYGKIKKTPFGNCGFHQLVARSLPDSVKAACDGPGVIAGDGNAANLRTMLGEVLIK